MVVRSRRAQSAVRSARRPLGSLYCRMSGGAGALVALLLMRSCRVQDTQSDKRQFSKFRPLSLIFKVVGWLVFLIPMVMEEGSGGASISLLRHLFVAVLLHVLLSSSKQCL